MPSTNPKHKRQPREVPKMGVNKARGKCGVVDCSEIGAHNENIANVEKYLAEMGCKLDVDKKKTRKVSLCKKHFKKYHKLKSKDDELIRKRDFGPKKSGGKEKSYRLLE